MKDKLFTLFIKLQILPLVLIIIDQLTKAWAISLLKYEGNSITVIDGFFKLTLLYNEGAAFSLLDTSTFLLTLVSLSAIIGIEYYIIVKKPKDKIFVVGLLIILAGAFGNFIDRAIFSKVTDFLSFTFFGWDFAVFNFADCCVSIGCVGLLIYMFFFSKEFKMDKTIEPINEKSELNE